MKIEVVAEDSSVNRIIQTIIKEAKTGEIGDGKIFVTEVTNVIRIRSGEEGAKAI